MKKKKLKGYAVLKEARMVARETASSFRRKGTIIPIFKESDGSFSVNYPKDKKAVFHVAVDEAGAQYTQKWVRNFCGVKMLNYVKVE